MKISVLILAIGTLLSKCLGLLREMLLAQKFGAGYISDSFVLCLSIPTVLITAVAGALLVNYIPIYSEAENKSDNEAKKLNGLLLTIFGIVSLLIIIVFFVFNKPILKLFAAGFDDKGFQYLSILSKITIFTTYIIVASNILKGYLQYKNKFLGTSLDGILMNLGIIIGILLSTTEKFYVLGIGVILGYFLSFIFLIILSKKAKFKAEFNLNVRNKYLKRILILTVPIILNDVVWQINGIVDKSVSSTLGTGYISIINYSNYIVETIVSVFASSMATVLFPKIVQVVKHKGMEEVKRETRSAFVDVFMFAIPTTIFLALFSYDIVKIIFFRGNFDENSLILTSNAVSIYSIAILFSSIKIVLFKVFYAVQDTSSPTKSAIISILLNIVLTIILVKYFQYVGIIVATIIASIVSSILLIVMFYKKIGKLFTKDMILKLSKIIIASIILAISALFIKNVTSKIILADTLINTIIKLGITFVSCFAIYALLLLIMKVVRRDKKV